MSGMRTDLWTLRPSRPSTNVSPWCSFPPSASKITCRLSPWVRSWRASLSPRCHHDKPRLRCNRDVCSTLLSRCPTFRTGRSLGLASPARVHKDEVPTGDVLPRHGGQAATPSPACPHLHLWPGPTVEDVRNHKGWRCSRCVHHVLTDALGQLVGAAEHGQCVTCHLPCTSALVFVPVFQDHIRCEAPGISLTCRDGDDDGDDGSHGDDVRYCTSPAPSHCHGN